MKKLQLLFFMGLFVSGVTFGSGNFGITLRVIARENYYTFAVIHLSEKYYLNSNDTYYRVQLLQFLDDNDMGNPFDRPSNIIIEGLVLKKKFEEVYGHTYGYNIDPYGQTNTVKTSFDGTSSALSFQRFIEENRVPATINNNIQ